MPIIEIGSHNEQEFKAHIAEQGFHRGLIPRDFGAKPPGGYRAMPPYPDTLLIPASEQQSRLDAQIANLASMYDLRNLYYDFLKSLDQNGLGLCWAFSSVKALMYAIIRAGLPPAILSAWYVAGKVKGWADQGGSGDESASYLADHGAPLMSECPSYKRSFDTPAVQASAALHKNVTWYDGTESRSKNLQIMISAFLRGKNPILDLNWLGHSMCGCRLVSINPLVVDADNSWGSTSQYGEKGLYRLTGNHAIPDNVCIVEEPTMVG